MPQPVLSIVLIARVSTSFRFRRTLDSALKQTYEPKIIWVVNANPSDNAFTLGLLEDLKPYQQVRLLPVDGRGTEFFYRNKALEQIDGEFVGFLNDIDVWDPDKALQQITQLNEHTNAGAAFVNGLVLVETPQGIIGNAVFEGAFSDPQIWMLKKTVTYGSQVIYRIDSLRSIGGFDNKLEVFGDLDALVRMFAKQDVVFNDLMPVKVHIPPLQDQRREEYEDNRYLLLKHVDFFLLNKRTAFEFCLMLARESLENLRWLHAILYTLRAVLKQPIRFTLLLVSMLARRLWELLKKGFHRLLLRIAIWKLRLALWMGKEPRLPGPAIKKRGKYKYQSAALDQLKEHEFVRLAEMWFMNNKTLEYVKIPQYVTVIPRGMFFGCNNLHTVEMPNTVTGIEANAFQGCGRLKKVQFAYGSMLQSIGAYAFAGCVSLAELELSESLNKLGKGAFAGCANLRYVAFSSLRRDAQTDAISFPSSLQTIPNFAFAGCTALERVMFEPGSMLTKLDTGAFYRCYALETMKITGKVHTIGNYALACCTQLQYLDMPLIDYVQHIGRHAFEYCKGLNNLYIPNSIKRIRAYTFRGCISLQRVRIPQGVKNVGRRAFADCRLLRNVTIMDETTHYKPSSFPKQARVMLYRPTENRPTENNTYD